MFSTTCVAYSLDGKKLASAGHFTMKIWDASVGRELRTLAGHTDAVWGVAFSPDSQLVASASWDATVRIWEVATDRCRTILAGHEDAVLSVAFSPRWHSSGLRGWGSENPNLGREEWTAEGDLAGA